MKKQKIEVKIDDLLRHCNWCEECKPKAFDIADYFMKRGRFAKKKIIQTGKKRWLLPENDIIEVRCPQGNEVPIE